MSTLSTIGAVNGFPAFLMFMVFFAPLLFVIFYPPSVPKDKDGD